MYIFIYYGLDVTNVCVVPDRYYIILIHNTQ